MNSQLEFLVKSVRHNKALRVHAAGVNHRPLCALRVPKFKFIIAWQLDPGPVNCKVCLKISTANQLCKP